VKKQRSSVITFGFVVLMMALALIILLVLSETSKPTVPITINLTNSVSNVNAIAKSLSLKSDLDGSSCWLWSGQIVIKSPDPAAGFFGGGMARIQPQNPNDSLHCQTLNEITIGTDVLQTKDVNYLGCLIQKEYNTLPAQKWLYSYIVQENYPLDNSSVISGFTSLNDYFSIRELSIDCQKILMASVRLPTGLPKLQSPMAIGDSITCADLIDIQTLGNFHVIYLGGDISYYIENCK